MRRHALVLTVIMLLNAMLSSPPRAFSQSLSELYLLANIFNENATAANKLSSGLGATVAMHENLRSEFAGIDYGNSVRTSFLLMPGTAMSPPLGAMLTHATCNVLASQPGKLGKIGVTGLILHGVLFTVGMLGEPITYKVLNPRTFNLPKATIVIGNIALPELVVKHRI